MGSSFGYHLALLLVGKVWDKDKGLKEDSTCDWDYGKCQGSYPFLSGYKINFTAPIIFSSYNLNFAVPIPKIWVL